MPRFGKSSEEKLKVLHPSLVLVMRSAIEIMDFKIVWTVRNAETQALLVETGQSKKLESKHLLQPDGFSHAVDVIPFYAWKDPQMNWNDTKSFYYLAGIIMSNAYLLGVKVRYGGDWNMNNDLNDQKFFDLGHFEFCGTI